MLERILKANENIKPINIFDHDFLYTAYADDTTFFIKDKNSVIELLNVFDNFSEVSGLKPNKTKCEIAGIGSLKGVNVALCGLKSVNLNYETIKILGCHFSYNKKIQQENNFRKHVTNIENVLNAWRMRHLTLEGKINVFKSLAISKIIHLALVTPIFNDIVDYLSKLQKKFIWKNKNPKIKHDTLCKNYEQGGLKSVNIFSKIVSLQCSWVQKLFDKIFHEWKVIPLYLFELYLGKNFKFHSNLLIRSSLLQKFPSYYQEIFKNWCKYLSSSVSVTSTIMSQFLWYNSYILIDKKSFIFSGMSNSSMKTFIPGQKFYFFAKICEKIQTRSLFCLLV